MNIFRKNKNYSFSEIIDICDKNGLITVDCLKDENMISVEEYNDGDLGDCLFEFSRINNDFFKLTWSETNINLIPTKKIRNNVSPESHPSRININNMQTEIKDYV